MSNIAKLVCSSLMVTIIIMLPGIVRAESASLQHDCTMKLFEKLRDLELMRHNVEDCYRMEKRPQRLAGLAGHSRWDVAELDAALVTRVFGHLAGTSECEKFLQEYRTLIQRPDFRELYTDELFSAYIRLLDLGRSRFLNQLKKQQESLTRDISHQPDGASASFIQVKMVTSGHAEELERFDNKRAVPAVHLREMPLSESPFLVVDWKNMPRIHVYSVFRFSSCGSAELPIDLRYSNHVCEPSGAQFVDRRVGELFEAVAVKQIPDVQSTLPHRVEFHKERDNGRLKGNTLPAQPLTKVVMTPTHRKDSLK